MARKGGNPLLCSKRVGEELMAAQPITVKLPLSADAYVRSLPNRAEWLRKAIDAQIKQDMKEQSA